MEERKPPIVPCGAAFAAMGVPARRWATRTDLLKQLQQARHHLDTAPLDIISVGSSAEAAGLSLHHFHRLFREVNGLTPHQYLTRRRMEEARRLLTETNRPIGRIALEVGIADPSAFSRLFRAATGFTPSSFRSSGQEASR